MRAMNKIMPDMQPLDKFGAINLCNKSAGSNQIKKYNYQIEKS